MLWRIKPNAAELLGVPNRTWREKLQSTLDCIELSLDLVFLRFFTPVAFEEACNGVLVKTVKVALLERNLLRVSDLDRLRSGLRVDEKIIHVVSVNKAIIEDTVPIVPTANKGVGTA